MNHMSRDMYGNQFTWNHSHWTRPAHVLNSIVTLLSLFFLFFQPWIIADIHVASRLLYNNQLSGTIPTQIHLSSLLSSAYLWLSYNPLCYNINYASWAASTDYSFVTFCNATNCPNNYRATCASCHCNTTSAICTSGISGNGSCICTPDFPGCSACSVGYYGPVCNPGKWLKTWFRLFWTFFFFFLLVLCTMKFTVQMEPPPTLLGPKLSLERMGPLPVLLGISPPILQYPAIRMADLPPGGSNPCQPVYCPAGSSSDASWPQTLGGQYGTYTCLTGYYTSNPSVYCTQNGGSASWGALIPVNQSTVALDPLLTPPGPKFSLE